MPQRHLIKVYMKAGYAGADLEEAQACFTRAGIAPETVDEDPTVLQGLTRLTTTREQRTELQVCLRQYGTFTPEG